MSSKCWESLGELFYIARCWVKANVLPLRHACGIKPNENRLSNKQKNEDVKAITKTVQRISILLDRADRLYEQILESVN